MQDYARQQLVQGYISDCVLVSSLLAECRPLVVVNFEAGRHVDSSIHCPGDVIQIKIVGTLKIFEAVRGFEGYLSEPEKSTVRVLHALTDEVCCSLAKDDPAFTETNRYESNSSYSTRKGVNEHPVRAWSTPRGFPNNTKGVRYDRS